MLDSKLKLSPCVIKKFEEKIEKFCFYNAKDKTFWNTDLALGSIISALDGSLTVKDVLEIVLSNNKNLDKNVLSESLLDVFEYLLKEGFLVESV